MANRVRGIRQKLPPNIVIGTGNAVRGTTLPAQAISLPVLLNKLAQQGSIPLPGGGGITALTGDVTAGPGSGSQAATLATVNTDVGSYTSANITVNAKGLVTAAANGTPPAFNSRGAWAGSSAYAAFDVVTYSGSAYLCYSPVSAPASGITVDGTATSYNNSTTPTVALTTADSNDIIVVVIQAVSFAGAPAVSGVADTAGLSWTKRKQFQFTPSFPSTNGYSDTEIWWAKAASPLSGDTITVTLNETCNACLTVIGFHGAASLTAPWDTNAALPATADNQSNTSPSVTVSTSIGSGDGIVLFTEMSSAHGGGWSLGTVTGYTGVTPLPHGGSVDGGVFYAHIVSDLTSSTITSNDSDAYWSSIGDCIDGGATPNTAPSLDDGHWIAQGASGTSYITSVDANFAVSSSELELATIASGDVLGNSGSSTAEPTAATMTAMLDRAFGSTEGQLLQRGATVWQVLAPGTAGQFLQSGGAGALNLWAAGSSTTYTAGAGLALTGTVFSEIVPVLNGKSDTTSIAIGGGLQGSSYTGSLNVAFGVGALSSTTTGTQNVAVGENALTSNTTGASNFGLGKGSLNLNTSGMGNVAIGTNSLSQSVAVGGIVAIGTSALKSLISGTNNVAIGNLAAQKSTGSNNTVIGYEALSSLVGGNGNTVIGYNGLDNATSGNNNTVIGANAAQALVSAGSNTIIGFQVGNTTLSTGTSNILIGTSSAIDTPLSSTSNYLNIGGAILGSLTGTINYKASQTNDNASAGAIGEYVSSTVLVGSEVSLTTATPANITSISLTAGDWDVNATIAFDPSSTAVQTLSQAGISSTTATLPTAPGAGGYVSFPLTFPVSVDAVFPVGITRISIAATTTIYLVASTTFSGVGATVGGYGFIGARRAR